MGCCCEHRAPRRLRFVPPAVVALLIAWLYGSFVRFAQPQLLARSVGVLELLAFHVMAFLLCASLGQCLLSNDSFVARRKKGDPLPPPPPLAAEAKANGARRFCRRCQVWKADRMHHCSSCKRCVLKMDHHCVYINKYAPCEYTLRALAAHPRRRACVDASGTTTTSSFSSSSAGARRRVCTSRASFSGTFSWTTSTTRPRSSSTDASISGRRRCR
jgi:hypothetical protein